MDGAPEHYQNTYFLLISFYVCTCSFPVFVLRFEAEIGGMRIIRKSGSAQEFVRLPIMNTVSGYYVMASSLGITLGMVWELERSAFDWTDHEVVW